MSIVDNRIGRDWIDIAMSGFILKNETFMIKLLSIIKKNHMKGFEFIIDEIYEGINYKKPYT